MAWTPDELTRSVAAALEERADADKAVRMAAYMKTDMAFYGVQKPGLSEVLRAVRSSFPVTSPEEYTSAVEALWARPYREEKYLAISIAARYRPYITFDRLWLFRRLIQEGAWWDFVDDVAVRCVGHVLLNERPQMSPVLDEWIDDADMWIRRSALIAHLKHKDATDREQLFDHCQRRMDETEFFIRKAIGWALREYAKTDPDAVRAFALAHRDRMSGLSFREATKHLGLS